MMNKQQRDKKKKEKRSDDRFVRMEQTFEGEQASEFPRRWESNELRSTIIPFYLIALAVSTRYHYVCKHARETFTQ
jgi:hypothetical protein